MSYSLYTNKSLIYFIVITGWVKMPLGACKTLDLKRAKMIVAITVVVVILSATITYIFTEGLNSDVRIMAIAGIMLIEMFGIFCFNMFFYGVYKDNKGAEKNKNIVEKAENFKLEKSRN
jgi:hypothetical protein